MSEEEQANCRDEFLRAVRRGNLDRVKDFVSRGVNVEAPGWDSLNLASSYGHLHVVKYLVDDCHVDASTKGTHGRTVLHSTALHGCPDGDRDSCLKIVQYLTQDCQVDPATKDNKGWTVLHCATEGYGYGSGTQSFFSIFEGSANRCNRVDVIRYLIKDCHVDPTAKNKKGLTAFHVACTQGRLNLIRFFIQDCQFYLFYNHDNE